MNLLVKGNPRKFHYHVTRHRGRHWYRLLRIRNHLRRHRGIARQYEALKKDLAASHPDDRQGYTARQDPVLEGGQRPRGDRDRSPDAPGAV